MLVDRQRLGEVVGYVEHTGNMLDAELSLADAVPQPMKAHVYALRQFRGDCVMSEPDGKFIVTQDGGRRLRVAEIVENAPLFEGDFGGGK
jgi:hypothetical protein